MSTARKSPKRSSTKTAASRRKTAAKASPTRHPAKVAPAMAHVRATGAHVAEPYEAAMAFGQDQVTRASTTLFEGYGRIAAANMSQVDALMRSSGAVARGIEDLGKAWLDLSQKSLTDGATVAKAITGARSLQDVIELQADLTRMMLDRLLGETMRISELSAKVAGEATAPLQALFGTILDRTRLRAA